jgi:magnesium chelatase subunit I
VLEERDIQVRGYQIRLPLDLLLVASANPEDYTNRGRMITPLKDRFGSQIRTHYPLEVETELAIMEQESRSWPARRLGGHPDGPSVDVSVPAYLGEVIATVSHLARSSSHVNQRSGVSVRMSVTNLEAVAANALRRGLRAGETSAVARIDDLDAMAASSGGKIEIESLDDSGGGAVFDNLVADTGEDVPSAQLAGLLDTVPALRAPVEALAGGDQSVPAVAAAVAFVLEGLHLSKRLNKDTSAGGWAHRSTYRAR